VEAGVVGNGAAAVTNASISNTTQFGTTLAVPAGSIQVAALGDINGNVLKTVDNSDGTSSLVVSGTVTSGGCRAGLYHFRADGQPDAGRGNYGGADVHDGSDRSVVVDDGGCVAG
jgi:hypothetical protein